MHLAFKRPHIVAVVPAWQPLTGPFRVLALVAISSEGEERRYAMPLAVAMSAAIRKMNGVDPFARLTPTLERIAVGWPNPISTNSCPGTISPTERLLKAYACGIGTT